MNEWRTTKMRSTLFEEIDQAVGRIKVRNTPKYRSVSDFITRACLMLLDKEGIKMEVRT